MNNIVARKNHFRIAVVIVAALLTAASAKTTLADENPAASVDRKKILELCKQGNFLAALPGLKELAKADPADNYVSEELALALLMSAHENDDVEQQKAKRIAARNVLLNARDHGDKSNLLIVLLDQIPEDGSMKPFSDKKGVNDAMQRAELEFAQGKLDNAIEFYQKAFKLDPNLYVAALFTGDMYFRSDKQKEAGEWFARAIKIDPNCETAYRYWGDALMKDKKPAEAKDKFIEAVIADPYRRASWIGLKQWAHKTGATITLARWQPLAAGEDITAGDKIDLQISKAYQAARDQWKSEKFKQQFPREAQYRHAAAEEIEALTSALDALEKLPKTQQEDITDQSLLLQRIRKADLLEPYVLLLCADEGISKDYPPYRDAHRPQLHQFIEQFIIGKPAEEKQ